MRRTLFLLTFHLSLTAAGRAEMAGALALSVPLKVDVAAGPNWLDVEDV